MPASYLNFPFDPELFLLRWQNFQDPTLLAMLNSGAMVDNAEIRQLISNGSDVYTIPYYNVIGGEPDNYDGQTDIRVDVPSGVSQSGIVYGRAHAWKDLDFIHAFNSGADPMQQITSQVAKYWQKQRQKTVLGILDGIFKISDDSTDNWDIWNAHTFDIASDTATATAANKLDAVSAADAMQKAVGDNASIFTMAWMHSRVATNLAGLQLLEYRKYTDAQGIERTVNIADFNGLTVIVDDDAPVADSSSASGEKEYTTYLMGVGALQYAPTTVPHPVEVSRVPLEAGGYNVFINRLRETIHPNGFTFTAPSASYTHSPTFEQLTAAANWKLVAPAKTIPMARIISNG